MLVEPEKPRVGNGEGFSRRRYQGQTPRKLSRAGGRQRILRNQWMLAGLDPLPRPAAPNCACAEQPKGGEKTILEECSVCLDDPILIVWAYFSGRRLALEERKCKDA